MNGQHGGKREGAGRKPGSKTSDHAAQFEEARARKESALAGLREIELDREARKLIPAWEVEEAVSVAFAKIAQRLNSIADDLERKGLVSPEGAQSVEQTIHAVMDSTADDLKSLGA